MCRFYSNTFKSFLLIGDTFLTLLKRTLLNGLNKFGVSFVQHIAIRYKILEQNFVGISPRQGLSHRLLF